MYSVFSERRCVNRLILKSILKTVILQNIGIYIHACRDDASYLDADFN